MGDGKRIIIFIEGVKENPMVENENQTENESNTTKKSINKQHAFTQEINHSNENGIIVIIVVAIWFLDVCVCPHGGCTL